MDIARWIKTGIGAGINVMGDIAIGVIILTVVARIFSIEAPWYFYLPAAFLFIGFSCLPDIDFIFKVFSGGVIDESHRMAPHLPLFMIPIVCGVTCLICFLVGANIIFWLFVSFFSLCLHYLHDSVGRDVDLGIKWLWPFVKLPMKFFTREGGKFHLVYIFSEEEIRRPKDDKDEWVRKYYSSLTREVVFCGSLFVVAILLTVFW